MSGLIGFGKTTTTDNGYGFEVFLNDIYGDFDGDGTNPCFDLNSTGTGDATNEVDISEVSIVQCWSPGFTIRNQQTSNNVRNIRIFGLRVDGGGGSPQTLYSSTGWDLVTVGDTSLSEGTVDATTCVACEFVGPMPGKFALRFTAPAVTSAPLNQRWQYHLTGSGYGGGAWVQYAAGLIKLTPTIGPLASQEYMFKVGTSTNVVGPVVVDGATQENGWTYSVAGNPPYPNVLNSQGYPLTSVTSGAPTFSLTANTPVNLNTSATSTAPTYIGTGGTGTMATPVTIGTSLSVTTLASGSLTLSNVGAGNGVDALCLATGNLVIANSSCTSSSLRFKTGLLPYDGSALDLLPRLDVESFRMKPGPARNPDPNYGSRQLGLIAENVAKVAPDCALYEKDMKTPRSYRPECVIALLVKGEQELTAQNLALKARIAKFEQVQKDRQPAAVQH